jgi:RNA polymerase sigma-70 factor (ECF subfamily)
MSAIEDEEHRLMILAHQGDTAASEQLLARYRDRLRQLAGFRIDPRLRRRLDASDIVQEAMLKASRRMNVWLADPRIPLFLWMRMIVAETLVDAHRHHLGVQGRDPRREEYDAHHWTSHSSIPCLAEQLIGSMTPPSKAAEREELAGRIRCILEELDPLDREIIALRHGEQLSRQEAADVLGISVETAAKRYVRAVARLRQRMAEESIG